MSLILQSLNTQQGQAVSLPAEHALILAGAGSGKTRVLTSRIAWLVQSGMCSPHQLLAVTFTNKAAKEMLARLTAMLPINTRGMWIGTFHGLCNRMLRTHHKEAGLPSLFQILDSGDQLAAIKRLLKSLNVDDRKFPPKELQWFINAQKEAGLRASDVEAWDDFTRRKVELFAAYDAQCQREGVVDFAELLLRCYELLRNNELLRAHYQSRFRHILVDEFQDTNRLQYLWLKLLAGAGAEDGASIFAVGDDDQSIYAFRGADIGNMADFEREFQVKHVIRLEQNYRSHGNILDAANAIIKNNTARLGKNLWTDAGAGEPIRVFEAYGDQEEARWIVEEIRSLAAEGHVRREIALLYRSNAQSRVLEHALFTAGLPYRVYGGLRFFERQEVKHAMAYLRLIANPDDDTAFSRVVNFPTRGIGARSLETLQDMAMQAGSSLHGAIRFVPGKAGASLAAFAQMIGDMKKALDLPLPELVAHVLKQSNLVRHYETEKEGQERIDNLEELVNAAANFIAEDGAVPDGEAGGPSALAAFLTHASLEAGEHQSGESDDALQLMTVHSAKGLEFDAVFLTGLEEGLFPHDNSAMELKGLEEERRLMYVAVTRARRRLYLSFAQTRMLHGQTRFNIQSRFVDEIPEALLKWLTPRKRKANSLAGASYFVNGNSGDGGSKTVHGGSYYDRSGDYASPAPTPVQRSNAPKGNTRLGTTPRAQTQPDLGGLRLGQNVRHAKFGVGVIIDANCTGRDPQVQVNFGGAGVKWLSLAVAKLEGL